MWLLGALGKLPRVKASTAGEGHERRYFYGSVWAVTIAQPVLWFLWKALPRSTGIRYLEARRVHRHPRVRRQHGPARIVAADATNRARRTGGIRLIPHSPLPLPSRSHSQLPTPHSPLPTILLAALVAAVTWPPAPTDKDPWPKTVDEFRAAVQAVLERDRRAGRGIALVRLDGVEWAGGVGLADRDAQDAGHRRHALPRRLDQQDVHRHRRSCSCTKTTSSISNAGRRDRAGVDDRQRLGFDRSGARHPPAAAHRRLRRHALQRDVQLSRSRRTCRCRGAAHQPGVAVRALAARHAHVVLESRLRGRRLRHREGHRASRTRTASRADLRARSACRRAASPHRGRRRAAGEGLSRSHRPAGAVSRRSICGPPATCTPRRASSARSCRCCSTGARPTNELVIDPEYLSNMEHPRTTLASKAGLTTATDRHRQLVRRGLPGARPRRRHRRLLVAYGYSTSRDVGYVVLLNATHSRGRRCDASRELAVRYLKADVEPPAKPRGTRAPRRRCATTRATTTTPTRATRRWRS